MSGSALEQGPAARRWWCRRRTRSRRRRTTGWTLGNARDVHGVRGDRMCVFLSMCVCVCVCHTHTHTLSLSLSFTLSLSLSFSRFLLQLLRTLSQCTDSHTHAYTHTQHHSNTRATCRHAALLEEALIRRAGTTPRAHHLPPPVHLHKSTRLPRAHAQASSRKS